MEPQEILDTCKHLGVVLRINQGMLTANPKKRLNETLLREIKDNRAAIIEILETQAQDEGDLVITEEAPAEPPKPNVAQQILRFAESQGVSITLDSPSPIGRIVCKTPIDPRFGMPMPLEQKLATLVMNHMAELTKELRAPYMPVLPARGSEEAAKRSIWERMAVPDDLLPDESERTEMVRDLLMGGQDPGVHATSAAQRRNAALSEQLPTIIAPPRT
jgi:hypothetical protein